MNFQFEQYVIKVINGEKGGFFPIFLRCVFSPLSLFYGFIVFLRNVCFDWSFLKSEKFKVSVISVGNITAGGTGKTPVTLLLASELKARVKLAILSRGYRSPSEKYEKPLPVSDGKDILSTAKECGDEAFFLAQSLPEVCVYVGRKRCLSAKMAVENGAEMIILDDGLQHRALYRNHDLIIIDAQAPLGNGYYLPSGFLRDSPKSLRRASLLVINHCRDEAHYYQIRAKLARYTVAPTVGLKQANLQLLDSEDRVIADTANLKAAIFCGIAKPTYFIEAVKRLEITIVGERICPDHLTLTNEELSDFAAEAKDQGANYLICTEKDWVKLENIPLLSTPIIRARQQLRFAFDRENWKKFINNLLEE